MTGACPMKFTDPSGKTASDLGKYVTVWKNQSDGTGKVLLDVFHTEAPLVGASPKTIP
jgi:hypothetical protein